MKTMVFTMQNLTACFKSSEVLQCPESRGIVRRGGGGLNAQLGDPSSEKTWDNSGPWGWCCHSDDKAPVRWCLNSRGLAASLAHLADTMLLLELLGRKSWSRKVPGSEQCKCSG